MNSLCWSCQFANARLDKDGGCGFHRRDYITRKPEWIPIGTVAQPRHARHGKNQPYTYFALIVTKCPRYQVSANWQRDQEEIRLNKSEGQQKRKKEAIA